MNPRKKPASNQRRSGARQRRAQNLLEVTVRSRLANQQRNRRALLFATKLFLMVAVVSGSIYGIREGLRRFFWENPEYSLAVVEINNDGNGISRETVLSTAGLTLGQNVFSISLAKAREAVAALPQVDHVEFQRVLPNKISIDLTERRPVAWLASSESEDPSASDKSFLIDNKGILFKPKRQVPEYLRLPAIYGVPAENFLQGEVVETPEVRAALDLIQQNGETGRFQLQSIDLSKGYCMVVTDAKRAKIVFGLEHVDRQLDRLGALLDHLAPSHQEIQTVNLMVERNLPVTFVPPPGQEPEAAASVPPHPEKSETKEEKSVAEKPKPVEKPARAEKASHVEKSRRKPEPRKAEPQKSRASSRKSSNAPAPSVHRKSAPEAPVRKKRPESEPMIRRALPVHPIGPVATLIPR